MTQNHKGVMSSGNTGGFNKTGQDEGPGYPMSEHGAQKAKNGGRQGGRQSTESHVNQGKSETYETEGKMED